MAETDPDVSAIGPPDDWPEDLRYVWKALYDFCRMVNFALVFGGRYPVDVFLDTMTAVMYRLLAMDYERDSACEAIRLGLLAYSCSIFLQWQYLGATYPVFNAEFRDSLMNIEALGLDPRFALWLLAVGSSTAFDESDNDWLKPMLRTYSRLCGIKSWSEMQCVLKCMIWVPSLQNEKGGHSFESIYNSL